MVLIKFANSKTKRLISLLSLNIMLHLNLKCTCNKHTGLLGNRNPTVIKLSSCGVHFKLVSVCSEILPNVKQNHTISIPLQGFKYLAGSVY